MLKLVPISIIIPILLEGMIMMGLILVLPICKIAPEISTTRGHIRLFAYMPRFLGYDHFSSPQVLCFPRSKKRLVILFLLLFLTGKYPSPPPFLLLIHSTSHLLQNHQLLPSSIIPLAFQASSYGT